MERRVCACVRLLVSACVSRCLCVSGRLYVCLRVCVCVSLRVSVNVWACLGVFVRVCACQILHNLFSKSNNHVNIFTDCCLPYCQRCSLPGLAIGGTIVRCFRLYYAEAPLLGQYGRHLSAADRPDVQRYRRTMPGWHDGLLLHLRLLLPPGSALHAAE